MNSGRSIKKICCIGANSIGGPFSSVIAFKCPEIEVKVIDLNEEIIMQWNLEKLPIFENNLQEIMVKCRDKNLFFTSDTDLAIKEADIIFICADTDLKTHGMGTGRAVDLQPLEDAARLICNKATTSKIIVEKSTIPIRAAETVTAIFKANPLPGRNFIVISNPEFLTQGTAVNDLLFPERILIGGDKSAEADSAIEALISIYEHWVPRNKIITADMWSSQLAKLATNAFLAQRISSINSLTEMCEITNADVSEVALAIGMDSRIGSKGLEPSIGFGGPSFNKDILSIVYLCESLNLPQVANYWQKVVDINEYQKKRFTRRIMDAFFNTVKNKKIAIWGFAFKKDTAGTINSPAIYVSKKLLEEGASLNIYDPIVPRNQILQDLKKEFKEKELNDFDNSVNIFNDPYDAVRGAHGVVICTDWSEFNNLDYFKVYNDMMKPAHIFDGKNMLPHNELIQIGFTVFSIGKNLSPNFTPII